jgi:mannosyl-oligosaccharide alpha-1,2-mannosidase
MLRSFVKHEVLTFSGSLSLEFTRLAQLTGERKYFDAISKVMDHLDKAQNHTRIPGLWPSQVDTVGPSFSGNSFTLGAWADSLYEYLPKVSSNTV